MPRVVLFVPRAAGFFLISMSCASFSAQSVPVRQPSAAAGSQPAVVSARSRPRPFLLFARLGCSTAQAILPRKLFFRSAAESLPITPKATLSRVAGLSREFMPIRSRYRTECIRHESGLWEAMPIQRCPARPAVQARRPRLLWPLRRRCPRAPAKRFCKTRLGGAPSMTATVNDRRRRRFG